MLKILVTGVAGPAGSALATVLAEHGHFVVGVDLRPPASHPACAVLEAVPAAGDLRLSPALRNLVAQHRIDLLIPTVQDELPAVSAARRVLGCPVAVAGAEPVGLAQDKYLTALALGAAGVAVPATVAVDGQTPVDLVGRVGLPFVIKPRVSRGGRGVVVIDDPTSMGDVPSGSIAQAFAPGTEYAVQLYAGPDIDVVVLEKTELKDGRVGNAVRVVRREPGDVADVEATATASARALGLSGPADMDIRRLADGTPVVLEVNARFGAHCATVPEFVDRLLAEHSLLAAAQVP